jgi:hypothetical protein
MSDATSHKGHKAVLLFLVALCAYSTLPVFGIGFYRNGSNQLFFQLWYLVGFMIIAFFLMHELITPLPPKEDRHRLEDALHERTP